jgi:aryl-alcohol dehydrogenase-like predicted oxidoreductase
METTGRKLAPLPASKREYKTKRLALSSQNIAQKTGADSRLSLRRSPVMLPIPGTSKVKHLEENVATAELKLSEQEWQQLEEAAKKAA